MDEEVDLHGMGHHMDPHGQYAGPVMTRHQPPTYVPGHMMMEYDMGAHQVSSAPPVGYGHVLPGHPAPVMMMPMNAPTPQMPMHMQNVPEPSPPQTSPAMPKRSTRTRPATVVVREEIEESLASPKKRGPPKRKKTEATKSAISKRNAAVQHVVAHPQEMVPQLINYMPGTVAGMVVNKDGIPGVAEDPNAALLPPATVLPPIQRHRSSAEETRAAQRSANALREYQRRARETPVERAARRAANAARARQRRAEETPEERARRLHREALRQQRRRDNETEREKAARRAANALRQQERRAREAMNRQAQAVLREQLNNQQQQVVQMQLAHGQDGADEVGHHHQGHALFDPEADSAE